MRRAATRAAALLPLRRSAETMVPFFRSGRFMARAIGGDGYRNPGYPLKNGKSPWVSVFVDEGTDGTHTFGLLIPLLEYPAQPCSSLLLGWAEAFVSPAAGGIFAPQRQNGDPAPPPARRPSLLISCSPGRCVGGGDGLPLQSPQYCARSKRYRSRGQERNILPLRSKQNDDQADTSTSDKTYTQIDDGSPLGVAIVVLGGSWVALGGGQDVPQLPSSVMDGVGGSYSGSTDDDALIWAVFATASVAAGISRLVRYYWDKKKGG